MSKNNISLKDASLKQLAREMVRRKQASIQNLEQEKAAIDAKIRDMKTETVVVEKSGKKVKKMQKMMKREKVAADKTLKSSLIKIAADGEAHSIKEFMDGLDKQGWKTSSDKPYSLVAGMLSTQKKTFERVSRGSYKLIPAVLE